MLLISRCQFNLVLLLSPSSLKHFKWGLKIYLRAELCNFHKNTLFNNGRHPNVKVNIDFHLDDNLAVANALMNTKHALI